MAFGLAGSLMLSDRPVLPNTDFFVNTDRPAFPLWPLLFITIACGAISGFHATQSPLMTRCMESEKHGRMLFYGPMIAEGVLGLIWVTLGLSFYESPEALGAVIKAGTPTLVVQEISMALLGPIGGMLAILAWWCCPFPRATRRSAAPACGGRYPAHRSGPIGKRLMIAVPLFAAGIALTFVDFAVIWRYFGWANQTMSCVTLWAIAVYLARRERFHWIATLPAAFMTVVCVSYLCYAKIGFGMSVEMSTFIGIASAAASLVLFLSRGKRMPELENEASC